MPAGIKFPYGVATFDVIDVDGALHAEHTAALGFDYPDLAKP
jgi:hypothetical protein